VSDGWEKSKVVGGGGEGGQGNRKWLKKAPAGVSARWAAPGGGEGARHNRWQPLKRGEMCGGSPPKKRILPPSFGGAKGCFSSGAGALVV